MTKTVALKTSYISLANNYFDLIEKTRLEYLENEWMPKLLKEWINEGRLIDIASGKKV